MLTLLHGDALSKLAEVESESVQTCVTSPPYWGLRDYGVEGQLGLEKTPEEYVGKLVEIFRDVRRVLRKDGTLFLNLGDSYFGSGARSSNPGGETAKQKTNVGSFSVGVQRAISYGTSGKAPEDSLVSDCLCQSLCDACRVAYQTGKSHSGRWPDPTQFALPSAPTRARRESAPDRSPTSDSSLPADRNADATQGFESCVDRERERLPVSQASMIDESFPLHPEGSRPLAPPSVCQLCGCSLLDSVQASGRRAACSCDSERIGLRFHTSGRDVSDLAHLDYTSASLKHKDLVGIPWMVAFALRADGWYLRSDIIWSKPNPMPESVTDRPTKSHEYIFLLAKSQKYFFDADAVREPHVTGNRPDKWEGRTYDGKGPAVDDGRRNGSVRAYTMEPNGRNIRTVWTIATQPFSEAHFATFPPDLIKPCILAGAPVGGVVLDPFAGSGTTGKVAIELGRKAILIEPKAEYCEMIERRCKTTIGLPLTA